MVPKKIHHRIKPHEARILLMRDSTRYYPPIPPTVTTEIVRIRAAHESREALELARRCLVPCP
jgi:hypothetical protein